MTKDEMKQEAEEWVNKNKPVQDDWEDSDIIQAIIDTSEPREKRIAELEAKIEEMQEKLKVDKVKGQLTEAKEIIKCYLYADSGLDMLKAQWKAEQFLEEV